MNYTRERSESTVILTIIHCPAPQLSIVSEWDIHVAVVVSVRLWDWEPMETNKHFDAICVFPLLLIMTIFSCGTARIPSIGFPPNVLIIFMICWRNGPK